MAMVKLIIVFLLLLAGSSFAEVEHKIEYLPSGITEGEFIDGWVGDGASSTSSYKPSIFSDTKKIDGCSYADVTEQSWQNVTGVTPDPNATIVRVRCADAKFQQHVLDADFYVLWSEELLEIHEYCEENGVRVPCI